MKLEANITEKYEVKATELSPGVFGAVLDSVGFLHEYDVKEGDLLEVEVRVRKKDQK